MALATPLMIILLTTFSFHIMMFAIEVILSIIIPFLLYYAKKNSNEAYKKEAKQLMNYIAVTYASAHFFLTATTVMLLSFFPTFFVFAGRILFYPLGFIIIFLLLRLAMIAYFWYGWDSMPEKIHFITGIIFAVAGVVWVYLDTVLLAFMNTPSGLISVDPLKVNSFKLFINPTILPLLLTLVFGAIATTASFLVFRFTNRILAKRTIDYSSSMVRIFQHTGGIAYGLFIPSLLWYLYSLWIYSPHKIDNMLGEITGRSYSENLFPFFLVTIFLILASLGGFIHNSWGVSHGILYQLTEIAKIRYRFLGPLSAITLLSVVLLNFLSQSPYFVVAPSFINSVPAFNVNYATNPYANILGTYMITIFGFIPLLFAFFILMYFLFTGRIGGDTEIKGRIASELD